MHSTYTQNDLMREITQKIESEKESGAATIVADWVAHSVMDSHSDIDGADKDFHITCSYKTVRDAVRRVMGNFQKNEIAADPQMTMEGFEYLQTHYVIDRGGDQVMAHVMSMTYEELTAKAEEHGRQKKAAAKHEQELYRLRDRLFPERAAA
jgi:hypothetical protein